MGKKQSPFKTLLVSVAGILTSGTISFFYTFFTQIYPKTEARIDVLAEKIRASEKFESTVTSELSEIRNGQKELYQLLIGGRHKNNR